MINWTFYPSSSAPPDIIVSVVAVFDGTRNQISSSKHKLDSNAVLSRVAPGLAAAGFKVETGKKKANRIHVPVLFGKNGRVAKSFSADAYHEECGVVLEVEAGRAVDNNQFLKDLFQACMMQRVRHAAIAVRNNYRGHDDYSSVCTFFDTLYASSRLRLPLEGVLVLGY